MLNAMIIYKGRYGATRQYAEWLGEALHIPVAGPREISAEKLRQYDFLILGSSVYIGKLELTNWIKQNSRVLSGKKLFLFIVCATPPDQSEKLKEIEVRNVPDILKPVCTVFFLHGRMSLQQLSWKDRFLLRMGARMEKDPEEKKHMLENFDDVKKEHLHDLIEAGKAILRPEKVQG